MNGSAARAVPVVASTPGVLTANGVEVIITEGDEYTPTPAISLTILAYKRLRNIYNIYKEIL